MNVLSVIPIAFLAGLADNGWKLFDPSNEGGRFRARRSDTGLHAYKRAASNKRKRDRQRAR